MFLAVGKSIYHCDSDQLSFFESEDIISSVDGMVCLLYWTVSVVDVEYINLFVVKKLNLAIVRESLEYSGGCLFYLFRPPTLFQLIEKSGLSRGTFYKYKRILHSKGVLLNQWGRAYGEKRDWDN